MNAETYYDLESACLILKPHVICIDDLGGRDWVVDWVHIPAADRELCEWAWGLLEAAAPPRPVRRVPREPRAWGLGPAPRHITDAEWGPLMRAAITRWLDRVQAEAARVQAQAARDAAAAERAALLDARRLGVTAYLNLDPDAPSVVSQMVKLRKRLAAIRAADAAAAAEDARRAAVRAAARLATKQAALDRKAARLAAKAARDSRAR